LFYFTLVKLFKLPFHNIYILVSFANKTDIHDITEILLKVALSTINQPKPTRGSDLKNAIPGGVMHVLMEQPWELSNPHLYVRGCCSTFNNISVISWMSVLLAKETRIPGEYHRPVASHWQTCDRHWMHR
jgi:hypothetical protein